MPKLGQGILRVASCKLRVASSSCECEFELRVRVCELRVEMCELRVSVCEFNSTHTLRVEHCELRVSHICELNDFGFQCDLSACVCLRWALNDQIWICIHREYVFKTWSFIN